MTHLEAATECIQTKLKAKYRVLWESVVVRKKGNNMKKSIFT